MLARAENDVQEGFSHDRTSEAAANGRHCSLDRLWVYFRGARLCGRALGTHAYRLVRI